MNPLRVIRLKLRSLCQRREVKREIDDELRFHLEQRTAENIAAGMTPDEAAREARKRFGNVQGVREECRATRGAALGETLFQDVRFGLRMLRKNPGFAAITILTLMLGVAGNIVIFTIYNSLFLRPFPFPEPGRLVDLDETAPRWNLEYTGLSYPAFAAWREHNRSFQGMTTWQYGSCVLSIEGGAEWVNVARVSHDVLSVLRIQPALGRGFTPDEDKPGGPKVVLLSHNAWTRRFAGHPDIVGQTVRLDYEPRTIIGVLPPDQGMLIERDFWVPLAYDARRQQGWHLRGAGRLKDGITMEMARQDLLRVHRGLVAGERAYENTSPRLTSLCDRYFGDFRFMLRMLLGTVAVVLLIACGNVAALMLARGLARARELGLRLSLGATRWRVSRLIIVEGLLLAGLGGFAGMALGRRGLDLLLNSVPEKPPAWATLEMDWRVWLFALGIVLVASLLGALPVIRSALKLDLHAVVQSSARQSTGAGGGRRSLHTLVVAEVALTVLVMIQAGLLLRTFRHLQMVDPGYRPDHVLVYNLVLPAAKYSTWQSRTFFFQEHLQAVRRLPGVLSASAITAPPLGGHWGNFFTIENAPPQGPDDPDPVMLQRFTCPGYFETMKIPVVSGRTFTDTDGVNDGSRAVIVNETFAKRFWPKDDPVGKRIRHRHDGAKWMTVVGVVRDVKHYGLDQPVNPGVYIPYAQDPVSDMAIVARSAVPPEALVPAVRTLVRQTDPELPILSVVTMEERLRLSMWGRRLTASLFGIFSAIALAMAVGGIYGVFSYVVNRRRQEIGVRLALGAQRREILWLVVRQGLALSGIGIGIGLTGALLITPVTRNMVYGVSPFEPLTFVTVALGLLGVAAFACWMPARRAMNIQPMEALRCE